MQKNKILIIDDNPLDHMITSHVLRTVYKLWDVMVMESAEQALQFINSNSGNFADLPNLIILDLDMPGLNGIGFLEKFAYQNEEVKDFCKIVVLTASDVAADLESMKANPDVIKLISKPLDKTALSSVIAS